MMAGYWWMFLIRGIAALLMGAIGAILAVPLTMTILSVLDSFEATRWIGVLAQSPSSSGEHEKKGGGLETERLVEQGFQCCT
jgi:hypothetical protein